MPFQPPAYDPAQTPIGVDTADGLDDRPGTPTPYDQMAVNGQFADNPSDFATLFGLNEKPDSPIIERAEQCTAQHTFTAPWLEVLNRVKFISRGVIATDSEGNVWRVLSATVRRLPGDMGELVITAESISFDPPPDEFSVQPVELGVNIIKHPRYLYALLPNASDDATLADGKRTVVRSIQQYMEAPTEPQKQFIFSATGGNLWIRAGDSPGLKYAKAAAQEIIQKLWLQQDNPYLIGLVIKWSQYYYFSPHLNPGGYLENPITEGSLPDYFGSPSNDYTVDTIFDYIHLINPQSYAAPDGTGILSCLRLCDEVERQRTWYRLTRTWYCSPVGYWDANIYNQYPRPNSYLATNTPFPYNLVQQDPP